MATGRHAAHFLYIGGPRKENPRQASRSTGNIQLRGQFYTKMISTQGMNGFYTFDVPTQATDPTGLWNAYIKVGGTTFHKGLRIETIKPNRLKINLAFPKKLQATGQEFLCPTHLQPGFDRSNCLQTESQSRNVFIESEYTV